MTSSAYQKAGVDTLAGQTFTKKVGTLARTTHHAHVLPNDGGFAGLCALPEGYQKPILVSATDGVGTKLKLALACHQHHGIGIDLVAMCVNDVITQGAQPLFFLDYYATGQLDQVVAMAVLEGIREGCLQSDMALIGGETAEMPGLYAKKDYDVAGFCIGVVEESARMKPRCVQATDKLIALASNGVHANGFSLIRRLLEEKGINKDAMLDSEGTVSATLLKPTKIYVRAIRALLDASIRIHSIAHITGGGIFENLPRILPAHLMARVDQASWTWPFLFRWLQEQGELSATDMQHTFNCGVGMILCVPEEDVTPCLAQLKQAGEKAWCMGEILPKQSGEKVVWHP